MQRISSGLRWRARSARISSGVSHSVRTIGVSSAAAGDRLARGAGVGHAQVGHVLGLLGAQEARQVHPQQRRGREVAGGFFQRLAHRGFQRRLAGVEVAGRVVELQPFFGVLLHQQETAVIARAMTAATVTLGFQRSGAFMGAILPVRRHGRAC